MLSCDRSRCASNPTSGSAPNPGLYCSGACLLKFDACQCVRRADSWGRSWSAAEHQPDVDVREGRSSHRQRWGAAYADQDRQTSSPLWRPAVMSFLTLQHETRNRARRPRATPRCCCRTPTRQRNRHHMTPEIVDAMIDRQRQAEKAAAGSSPIVDDWPRRHQCLDALMHAVEEQRAGGGARTPDGSRWLVAELSRLLALGTRSEGWGRPLASPSACRHHDLVVEWLRSRPTTRSAKIGNPGNVCSAIRLWPRSRGRVRRSRTGRGGEPVFALRKRDQRGLANAEAAVSGGRGRRSGGALLRRPSPGGLFPPGPSACGSHVGRRRAWF